MKKKFFSPNGGYAGLYLHFPFCKKKCRYCDFLSFDCSRFNSPSEYQEKMTNYIELICKELDLIAEKCGRIDDLIREKGRVLDSCSGEEYWNSDCISGKKESGAEGFSGEKDRSLDSCSGEKGRGLDSCSGEKDRNSDSFPCGKHRNLDSFFEDRNRVIESVFIGGGTPSLMPHGAVSKLMEKVKQNFSLARDAEITIECNPDSVDEAKIAEYLSSGINRFSLGIQSLDDITLKSAGRVHSAQAAINAFNVLRDQGADNISVDLMAGLPGQTMHSVESTIECICGLQPEHISFYPLIIEEGTPIERDVERGICVLPDEDAEIAMQRLGIKLLSESGYARYEISNFARDGKQCRHNLNYWRCGEYYAAGLGAVSAKYDRESGTLYRFRNACDYNKYEEKIRNREIPCELQEISDHHDQMFERIMLGLRVIGGISKADFMRSFGVSIDQAFPASIERNSKKGLLTVDEDFMKLTERGLELQNMVLLDFLSESDDSRRAAHFK